MPLRRSRGVIVAPRPYEEMTLDELTREWVRLEEKRVALADGVEALRLQIQDAKDRVARFGEYADDRWYHATQRDMRRREAQLKALQLELKLVERLRHERLRVAKREHLRTHMEFHLARGRAHDRAFVRAAKRLLPEAAYLEIWREATAELEREGGGSDGPADPGQVAAEMSCGPADGAK